MERPSGLVGGVALGLGQFLIRWILGSRVSDLSTRYTAGVRSDGVFGSRLLRGGVKRFC